MDTKKISQVIILCFLTFMGGLMVGIAIKKHVFQIEAVKKGYAVFNSQTGEWQWKKIEVKQEKE